MLCVKGELQKPGGLGGDFWGDILNTDSLIASLGALGLARYLDLGVEDSNHTFLLIQPFFVTLSPERVKGVPHFDQLIKRHLDTWEDTLAPDFKGPQLRPCGPLRDQDNIVIGVEGG